VLRVSGRYVPDGCGGSCAMTALREDAHGEREMCLWAISKYFGD
jgi:hypothetical protein